MNPRRNLMRTDCKINLTTTMTTLMMTMLLAVPLTARATDGICEDYANRAWNAYNRAFNHQSAAEGNSIDPYRYDTNNQRAREYVRKGKRDEREARNYVTQTTQYANQAYDYSQQARQICNNVPLMDLHGEDANYDQIERMRSQARNAADNADNAAHNAKIMRENASTFFHNANSNFQRASMER